MLMGPQGMSIDGNAASAATAAANYAANPAAAASAAATSAATLADKAKISAHQENKNCHSEVPKADRFMKIEINHPQCTCILSVK